MSRDPITNASPRTSDTANTFELRGVHLASNDVKLAGSLYDVTCLNGVISSIEVHARGASDHAGTHSSNRMNTDGALLLPS